MSTRADPGDAVPLEVWGGVECTVNRVRSDYFDQLERSGHACRPEDLDLFAALGVRALRHAVLWERTAPEGLASADWAWADASLARLRELNVRPLVGLVHHGLRDLQQARLLGERAIAADAVDSPVACGRQEPRARVGGWT